MKNVLITGISGQDGIFLTKKYFSSAYDVAFMVLQEIQKIL